MNFLAHLFLSCDDEDLMIGNFIADFLKNKEVQNYSEAIQKGIQLHRQIDSFTDNHLVVRQGTKRLQKHHHKYAPVVIDVLYDYLLAKNWETYSNQSLASFTSNVYDILLKRLDELPTKLSKGLPNWIENDWLTQYGKKEGIRYTFKRMDERTKFPSNFQAAVEHLEADYESFDNEFNQFFPDVIQLASAYCD